MVIETILVPTLAAHPQINENRSQNNPGSQKSLPTDMEAALLIQLLLFSFTIDGIVIDIVTGVRTYQAIPNLLPSDLIVIGQDVVISSSRDLRGHGIERCGIVFHQITLKSVNWIHDVDVLLK